ncbi:hypothetical protein [uncultured Sphingomonas sp.]|uniref:hypothetical protein n=1 Tax=uncultured Sphingomonas sp. TaxID=158754 RepID=UPI0035C9A5E4
MAAAIVAAALEMAAVAPAVARDRATAIQPYIELSQVLTADVQSGDVLTYTSVAAGIDASIQSRRTSVSISARYERQIAWDRKAADADILTGVASAQVALAPGLTIGGGALATRTRSDIRGGAPVFFNGTDRNVSNVYSAYVGPALTTGNGPIKLGASYQFGYTKVTSPGYSTSGLAGTPLDRFDDSTTQVATATAGFAANTIAPFGATLSAAWEREDAGQLDQLYIGRFVRLDLVLPVARTVAIEGGVGYEKIESGARDPLLDADGQPVVDGRGRFATDPASPRRIAYRTDGLIYDAGIVWRPSPRTMLEGRVGRGYGSIRYTASLNYAPRPDIGLRIGVYDGIETFGRQLRDGIRSLPDTFVNTRDLLAQRFNGCTFGTAGGGASGACLNSVFQSVSTATYRARGVDAVLTKTRGQTVLGIGAGYADRRFYGTGGPGFTIDGVSDDSYYAQAFFSTPVGANAGISADLFGNYYDSGLAPGIYSIGATGSYYRNFGRLATTLSAGIYSFSQEGADDQVSAQALVGARYRF